MKNLIPLKLYLPVIVAALLFVASAHAQQTAPTLAADDYATQTNFRNKILEVRHRDPVSLRDTLRALGSGIRGATITASREFKTLTVRDFPENIVTIEEALKRLDVPETPQTGIELRIHVLVASNTAESANEYPPDLKDTIAQLQSTLNYKNYRLVNSLVQRTQEGATASGNGIAEFGGAAYVARVTGRYSYNIRNVTLDSTSQRTPLVQIGEFRFNGSFYFTAENSTSDAGVNTGISVRDGERIVVGTAALRDRAMILVLMARVIK